MTKSGIISEYEAFFKRVTEDQSEDYINKSLARMYKGENIDPSIKSSAVKNKSESDAVAGVVCKYLDLFDKINRVKRNQPEPKRSIEMVSNDLTSWLPEKDTEKRLLRRLYGYSKNKNVKFGSLGHLFYYEYPLENKLGSGRGRIDLMSYSPESNTICLIEGKQTRNRSDSLLSALLEIFTYHKQFDYDNFVQSNICQNLIQYMKDKEQISSLKYCCVVLLEKSANLQCLAYQQLMDIVADPDNTQYPNTLKLVRSIRKNQSVDLRFFTFTSEEPYIPNSLNGKYEVSEINVDFV